MASQSRTWVKCIYRTQPDPTRILELNKWPDPTQCEYMYVYSPTLFVDRCDLISLTARPADEKSCSALQLADMQKKFERSDTPTLPFLHNFECAFVRMDTVNSTAKFEVRSFTRSWDNSECLKTLCSPWIRRSRSLIFAPIKSAHMTSYKSVIVTLVLSCTVSEILQVFTARCTLVQSAVLRSHIVCPSVRDV